MKRGQSIVASKHVNCSKCSIRDKCRDDRKSRKFACSFFVEADPDNPSDKKFAQYLRNLATSESIVADRWQIDDGDAPAAPNFYRWVTSKKYLNFDPKPFPKQLQLGLKFFNDQCHWCSKDKDWLEEIPHDADIEEIPYRTQLLRHGRCPKCKRTRLDAIRAGKTVDYEDLVCVAGQRCVTGDTLVSTAHGQIAIEVLLKYASLGWSQCNIPVVLRDGTHATATAAYVSGREDTYEVVSANGLRVTGTGDHPILTTAGFVKIRDLTIDHNLVVPIGQNVWGVEQLSIDDIAEAVKARDVSRLFLADCKSFVKFLTLLEPYDRDGDVCINVSTSTGASHLAILLHNAGVACSVHRTSVTIAADYIASFKTLLGGDALAYTTYDSRVASITSRSLRVTYDLHVPVHHEFVANGLVNHNSGKCVVGDTRVRTERGLKKIKDCTITDRVMLAGKPYSITKYWKRPKRGVHRLVTALGYEIKATHDHKIMTVEGWRELKKAKTVRIETMFGPFPTRADYRAALASGQVREALLRIKNKKADLLDYLSLLDHDSLVAAVQDNVVEELFSEGVLGIKFKNAPTATSFHQTLLLFGIVAHKTDTILRIPQPWSRRYVRLIGIRDRHVAASVALSYKKINTYVNESACALLESYGKHLIATEMQAPAITTAWTEALQKMHARTFRRADVRPTLDALNRLRVTDGFMKHLVVSLLKSLTSHDAVWDAVVSCRPARAEQVYDIEVAEMHAFLGNGLVVHNSTSIGLVATYPIHQLLKLKNPSGFYGIKQGTILYSTVVGLTYGGAKTNVWDPLLATIQDSPWFQTYFDIMAQAAAERGEEELVRVKDSFIYFRNAALYMAPASPSRRTLRGKTRIMSTVDELAHFSSNDKLVNISGIEVWNALSRSMQTVRLGAYKLRKRGVVNVPPAMQIAISSPYETTDPIMTLYNKPTSRTYAVLYPTWEFNSEMTFEFLKPEFDRDATTAWRDFGCRPPYSAASFVSDIDPYRRVVKKDRKPCAVAETYVVKTGKGKRILTSAKLKWLWTDTSVGKVMAIDAGAHFNAFSIVVAHTNKAGKTVYDTLVEVHPTPGRPISFTRIYEDVMVPLIEKMNVKVLVSDRWQNKKIHDDAEDQHGITPIEHRLRYSDLLLWREALIEGRLELPKAELSPQDILYPPEELKTFINRPVASFIYESLRVVDVPGKKVEKPTEGSDDVWRAGVLAHTALQRDDVKAALVAGDVEKRTTGGLGAVASSRFDGSAIVPGAAVRPGAFSTHALATTGIGVLRR